MDEDSPSKLRALLVELKRRHVFRVAVVYGAVAWIVVQVANVAFPALHLPPWTVTLVVALALICFPIALVLAWAFEITPEGVRRTEPVAAGFPPAERRRGKLAATATAAVLVLAVGVTALVFLSGRGPAIDPERVVVAVFENRTGDSSLDRVGMMAVDWITQGLARTGLVDVVPSTAALLSSESVRQAGALSGLDRVRALAEETGAGTVVWGAYYRDGASLQFQAQVTDAVRRKLLAALEPVSSSIESPLEAVEVMRMRVMGALATRFNPRLATAANESAQPPLYEAYLEYAEGAESFVRRDFGEAIQHFYRAAALDSTYAPPLVWAALAHFFLGDFPSADSIARVVNRSRERLLRTERQWLDYVLAAVRGDLAGALRTAREAMEQMPGPLWRYSLGTSAAVAHRPREALEALERIDPEGPFMKGWWQYWTFLTGVHHSLGDYRRELELARRARRQYPDLLVLLNHEVRALAGLGRVEEVHQVIDQSLTLPRRGPATPGRLMMYAANELRAHGHAADAQALLESAIEWHRTRPGNEAAAVAHRATLAGALYLAGRRDEAEALLRPLAAQFPHDASYKAQLGGIAARRGNREEALRFMKDLETIERHPISSLPQPIWQADIAALLGEKERAVRLLEEAFANGAFFGTWVHADPDLESLRDYAPFRDLLRPKG